MIKNLGMAMALLAAAAPAAVGAFINTNDIDVYNQFAAGATVQDFESVATLTPLGLSSYANAYGNTAVPAGAQLGLQIPGLLFHSGGGSFNNPTGNPGTPTALLQLQPPINGDAHSGGVVVGSLAINTTNLDLDQFVEAGFINGNLQNRVGVWFNPSLGRALFSAFDANGQLLESGTGDPGNFVAVQRAANEIRSISIVSIEAQKGFTIDDLTYGTSTVVPEPGSITLLLIGTGLVWGVVACKRRAR